MNYLEHILEQTHGALFVRLDIYSRLVGCHPATPYNQISKKTFPLPTFKVGRTVSVRVADLAVFLENGIPLVNPAPDNRKPGAPAKYSAAARAKAAAGLAERKAARLAKQEAQAASKKGARHA